MLRQTHAFCSLFNFQGYRSIHFRFEFFFLRALRDALNVTLYRLSYDQLKFFTSNERAGSLIPPLLIIPYIYLLFSSENLTVNTMSPNWSSLSFLLPVCLRISSNYTLRVAKALTVYQKEEVRLHYHKVIWEFWFWGRRMDGKTFPSVLFEAGMSLSCQC